MTTIHESRIARAARAIAARLDNQPEVRLYARTYRAECKLDRIFHYMNRYCGNYWMESWGNNPMVIVRKNGA
jgi:hypothetical protein